MRRILLFTLLAARLALAGANRSVSPVRRSWNDASRSYRAQALGVDRRRSSGATKLPCASSLAGP